MTLSSGTLHMEISGAAFLIGLVAVCAIGIIGLRYVVSDDDGSDRFL